MFIFCGMLLVLQEFYKDENPDFLFWTCMAIVRNTGISSLYLA